MSKYKIYRLDDAKPKIAGRRNRIFNIVFTSAAALFGLVFNTLIQLDVHYSIYIVVFTVLISFLIWLYFYLRKNTDKLKQIGVLTISTTGIKKTIGNLETKHNYADIENIKLEKHFPAVRNRDVGVDYKSYLLKLFLTNKKEVNFIVSGDSIDVSMTIEQTLTFLEKRYGVNLVS